jgi:1-deoxy-D-xylulose-5-phosphate synthase
MGAGVPVKPRSSLLSGLRSPADVRRLDPGVLPHLAEEIRAELIAAVPTTGGHLGPNLGVVELTIALHRVFDSPRDTIIWDTGHQAYVHKMLTGRLPAFGTLRQAGGLSGYPSRRESEHDVVENSHASTALSYADGIAKAVELSPEPGRRVAAVVGDGALTGGMCWEAMNNLGAAPGRPVVIVLNDNERSYGPTAGHLADHLRSLRDGTAAGNIFEDLGLAYVGPVDGHDITAVERALRAATVLHHPVLVHVVTRKGAGYRPAEEDEADRLHTVSPPGGTSSPGRPWTDVFGEEIVRLAAERPDVVAVTAAMLRPTGLLPFSRRFPGRVFDVGIAEQHAVASAAGLATAGMHPVVAIYSTFLNRAFDQVLLDVGLHRAAVTFVLDRAGITGPDGPSHHGMWDVGLLRLVPGAKVAAPRDAEQMGLLLRDCLDHDGPSVLRFPRGRCGVPIPPRGRWGHADVLTPVGETADVLILAVGPLSRAAVDAVGTLAGRGVHAVAVDPRWVQPLDDELVSRAAAYRRVVTVEDNAACGGFGEALSRSLGGARSGGPRLRSLTLPESFIPAGARADILHAHGLDAEGIVAAATAP